MIHSAAMLVIQVKRVKVLGTGLPPIAVHAWSTLPLSLPTAVVDRTGLMRRGLGPRYRIFTTLADVGGLCTLTSSN